MVVMSNHFASCVCERGGVKSTSYGSICGGYIITLLYIITYRNVSRTESYYDHVNAAVLKQPRLIRGVSN